jgi:hypothetical protein
MIVLDDTCPLCGRGLAEGEDAFSAWGNFAAPPKLARFATAAMHWECYLAWPDRPEFARHAAAAWRLRAASDRELHRVLDHPEVLVHVRLGVAADGEVILFLHRLGHDLHIDLRDWDWWMASRLPPEGVHPAVASAWNAVRDPVRAALPSAAMIRGNYPPLPPEKQLDLDVPTDPAVYSLTVREDRWKELLQIQKEGLENSYFRRLIEYVGYYPDDEPAAERLRDGRPWIDKFLFEPRKLSANRESGLLWVLMGGWPKPTKPDIREAARRFLTEVAAAFPDHRASKYAAKLLAKWGLDGPETPEPK